MSTRKTRIDKGVPRKATPTARESVIRMYAQMDQPARLRFREDLDLIDTALVIASAKPQQPEGESLSGLPDEDQR